MFSPRNKEQSKSIKVLKRKKFEITTKDPMRDLKEITLRKTEK
jgi:hypothetical protein